MVARTLVVLPSVPAVRDGDGYFLDIKAVEGAELYARLWPGPVRLLCREGDRRTISYGRLYRADDLPFAIDFIPEKLPSDPSLFDDAAVVLAAGDYHFDFPAVDRAAAPVVFIIEYTLGTRIRIDWLNQGFSSKMGRSTLWTLQTELKRRRAFRRAAGLQCNGVPAFDAYRALTPSPLLYFDTRTPRDRIISAEQLARKQAEMLQGAPLRLAFSGRLERMKGADHLVEVARSLARSGTPFTLDIFGDGSLRESMGNAIMHAGLSDQVRLRGSLPFETELIPALIEGIDLFLCCHRQADPSCTYMETLSCGVPIVGYDNAAFVGVAAQGDIGVTIPMDDPAAAARAVTALASDRPRLAGMAANAAEVGEKNSFERVFAERVAHLRAIAGV